jgi:hypothetical protein
MTPPELAAALLALKATSGKLADSNPLKFALNELPDDADKILARIRHYEGSRAVLSTDLFPAFARVLGVTEADLLPGR